jgi:putative membrane protein
MITKINWEKIEKSVLEAQLKTSGKIKVVVLPQSDHYPAAHYRCGLLLAMLAALVPLKGHHYLFLSQGIFFLLGYLLAYVPFFKRLLTLSHEMKQEVHQEALQVFFENNLHNTPNRAGFLIMVSLLEKQVQVLADTGIHEKVEEGTWEKLVNDIIYLIRDKDLAHGLIMAVGASSAILSRYFPRNGK